MYTQKITTNEPLLEKLGNKFKLFHKLFFVLFIASVIAWVALIVLASVNLIINVQRSSISLQYFVELAEILFTGAIITSIIRVLGLFFRDISNKETPFSNDQVKRIRILSFLFVGYGIADLVMSVSFTSIEITEGVGLIHTLTSSSPEVMVSVNITAFIASIVVYALSMAFEYGSELQKQSDSFL